MDDTDAENIDDNKIDIIIAVVLIFLSFELLSK